MAGGSLPSPRPASLLPRARSRGGMAREHLRRAGKTAVIFFHQEKAVVGSRGGRHSRLPQPGALLRAGRSLPGFIAGSGQRFISIELRGIDVPCVLRLGIAKTGDARRRRAGGRVAAGSGGRPPEQGSGSPPEDVRQPSPAFRPPSLCPAAVKTLTASRELRHLQRVLCIIKRKLNSSSYSKCLLGIQLASAPLLYFLNLLI